MEKTKNSQIVEASDFQRALPSTPIPQPISSTATPPPTPHDWTFWTIPSALCILGFAAEHDNSMVFTALLTITFSIGLGGNGGGSQYVRIANAYSLPTTVIQPFVRQACNIFGRKKPAVLSVSLFALGRGIAGGANYITMLIAGRMIQGLGAGGIFVLIN